MSVGVLAEIACIEHRALLDLDPFCSTPADATYARDWMMVSGGNIVMTEQVSSAGSSRLTAANSSSGPESIQKSGGGKGVWVALLRPM